MSKVSNGIEDEIDKEIALGSELSVSTNFLYLNNLDYNRLCNVKHLDIITIYKNMKVIVRDSIFHSPTVVDKEII